jgi:biopolymer transport protein ExbB
MTRNVFKGFFRAGVFAVLLVGNLGIVAPAFSQEPAPAAAAPAGGTAEAPKAVEKTLMDRIHEGGWVMYPIGLCSVALIWLTVDLWMRTSVKKMAPPARTGGPGAGPVPRR